MKQNFQYIVRTCLISTIAMTIFPPPLFANEANLIIINEIAAYEKREYEWIELFNRSDESVNLEGWKFFENETKHDIKPFHGDYSMPAGDFAIIAEDAEKFLEKYPGFSKTVFDSSWSGLKESGEKIGLMDTKGEMHELFTYINAPDTSLERKNPELDDFSSENWTPHPENGTPGAQNTAFQDTEIVQKTENTTLENKSATENIEPDTDQTPEQTNAPPENENHTQNTQDTQNVSRNDARDNTSQETSSDEPKTAESKTSHDEINRSDLKNIIISELMPNPSGSDTSEEWIELANISDHAIALKGLFLDDEDGGSKPFALDASVLSPYDFLVIKSHESKLSLKNSGDAARLLLENGEILEEITYEDSAPEDKSFARDEEGAFTWSKMPTPGAENIIKNVEDAKNTDKNNAPANGDLSTNIFFSEIFANPEGNDTQDEWIELENTGTTDISLGNWKIEEGGGKTHALSHDLIVPAGGWLVLYRKKSGVSLNNSSEELSLFDFEGTFMDSIEYEKAPEEKSFTKIGIENQDDFWEWTTEITEGDENPSYEILRGIIEKQDEAETNGLTSFFLKTSNGLIEIEYGGADLSSGLPETLFIPGSEIEVIGKQLRLNQYELKKFTILQDAPPPEQEKNTNSALPAALFGVPIAAFTILNFLPVEKIKNLLNSLWK